jgi:hypothetical protein
MQAKEACVERRPAGGLSQTEEGVTAVLVALVVWLVVALVAWLLLGAYFLGRLPTVAARAQAPRTKNPKPGVGG